MDNSRGNIAIRSRRYNQVVFECGGDIILSAETQITSLLDAFDKFTERDLPGDI